MGDSDRAAAARLIGTVDAGERRLFERAQEYPAFERAVCAQVCEGGALFACVYAGKPRFTVAFEGDLPACAAEETGTLLKALVAREKRDAVVWCRSENANLRIVVEDAFQARSDYGSREMRVSKADFSDWKEPRLPADMGIAGYDPALLMDYLRLLERAMAHVIAPGTTPFVDGRNGFAREFPVLAARKRFHSLWAEGALAGVCFSRDGELDTIALDEKFRRRGAGYALLHAGLAGAFGNRDGDVCLYVVDQNTNALGFYRHVGMRETGHSARYLVTYAAVSPGPAGGI